MLIKFVTGFILSLVLVGILLTYMSGITKQYKKDSEYQFYRGLFVSCMVMFGQENDCRIAVQNAKDRQWFETPDPIQY